MPAASWRIMPARSISRCETISASFGFSFRMGRKNRDSRMGFGSKGFGGTGDAVKPDCPAKHKAGAPEMTLKRRRFLAFSADLRSFDDDWRFDIDLVVIGDGNRKREHPAPYGRHGYRGRPLVIAAPRGFDGLECPSRLLVGQPD